MHTVDWLEILSLAFALSIDAMVVSLCWSAAQKKIGLKDVLAFGGAFGLFQWLMPVLGYYAGETVIEYIKSFDHWVAFLLLCAVAFNMIREAGEDNAESEAISKKHLSAFSLFTLAVATSLDALAVGFSFSMAERSIAAPAVIIGVVCACLSGFCVLIGRYIARKVERYRKLLVYFGAIVLIAIGVEILFEHNVFNFIFN